MRLTAMLPRMIPVTVLSAIAIHLSGCDRTQPAASASGTPSDAAAAMPASEDAAAAATTAAPTPARSDLSVLPKAVPPSTSRDPQEVVLSWAKAVSLKDWPTAYGYWGDHGARSNMTLDQFSKQWGKLKQPDLEVGKGHQEGAAGSSYFTVPVTIVDGSRRIPGEVVFRRVNDIDGATSEQLRWHIESTTFKF